MIRSFLIGSLFSCLMQLAIGQDLPADGGIFKSTFKQQMAEGKSQTIECLNYGIFKSNTGWKDSKYYILMNEVLPGTIVKIQSTQTDKVVYAKVLGAMVHAKENEGLLIRISNASQASLGLRDLNSPLILTWNK